MFNIESNSTIIKVYLVEARNKFSSQDSLGRAQHSGGLENKTSVVLISVVCIIVVVVLFCLVFFSFISSFFPFFSSSIHTIFVKLFPFLIFFIQSFIRFILFVLFSFFNFFVFLISLSSNICNGKSAHFLVIVTIEWTCDIVWTRCTVQGGSENVDARAVFTFWVDWTHVHAAGRVLSSACQNLMIHSLFDNIHFSLQSRS